MVLSGRGNEERQHREQSGSMQSCLNRVVLIPSLSTAGLTPPLLCFLVKHVTHPQCDSAFIPPC